MTTSSTHPLTEPQENIPAASVVEPILLELASVRVLLDALGTVALFVTASVAFSVREALAVVAVVGLFVLASRWVRWRRSSRALSFRDIRDRTVTVG
ncbi:hypothetical protein [Rhodococcoides kyotonense]|uniref:Uncharacterized protein n=1 Tax=Rhodococcoides kyotonense TaxID=398843 RepID=A0A239LJT3_9NOCA|nr:hypothetical protein [Rhodococcus kyotonensis]SNT30083.1 hypothetical protein SAMN05421642_11374 [Rhodococcus kyotonensis]